MRMLELALGYVERGWPIYPLAPLQKCPPKGHHGRLEARTEREWVYRVWDLGWPIESHLYLKGTEETVFVENDVDYNIGIDTDGAGLVVIDIDVKKNDTECLHEGIQVDCVHCIKRSEPFGYDAWECLMLAAGTSDDRTYTVETPSGGSHLYWLANDAMSVKTQSGKLAPGIDVRATNGSIVAAGSKTEQGEYKVVRDIDPRPLPNWLRAALRKAGLATSDVEKGFKRETPPIRSGNETKYAQAALEGELATLAKAGAGARNEALNRTAFKLRRFCADGQLQGDMVAERLYRWAIDAGLKHQEAVRTIKSGLGV